MKETCCGKTFGDAQRRNAAIAWESKAEKMIDATMEQST